MYITTPSVNLVDESTLSVFLVNSLLCISLPRQWIRLLGSLTGSDIHNRLLARNTDNVDSSTGFTDGVVIYITDY